MDISDVTDTHFGGRISSNNELASGDFIEAYYEGALAHRGVVTDIAPDHELFWILDVPTGGRRLLDTAESEIRKGDSMHSQSVSV
ncbi:hypothetical protein PUN71_022090 [Arthrobacter sp. NQ7]|uniref:hypothetical protein n=1 Tax=Arthrobacter sp. NQ7 TaxID=3032303 RepID=UPI00240FCF26|nr:hypothetical protein [Arthrobacter sp. NQ7]MDJ0459902.1 hypothetical protein [Arthrobacter sp. NQ7]